MTKKYELTNNTIVVNGVTLYQIKALKDFGSISKGDLGGYIEKEENLSQTDKAWVSGNAQVYNNARVSDNAWVSGNAQVSVNARVYGYAFVSGDAWVSDNAWVYGNARVYGYAFVSGHARVSGDAYLCGKKAYTKGWFIGGDDTSKITNITEQTGSTYWKAQYILGDYEINDIEQENKTETIQIGNKTYEVTDELKSALRNLKEINN